MEMNTYQYTQNKQWNQDPDPSLDSNKTLLILFGLSEQSKISTVINTLKTQFSQSLIIGCSTSGEIMGESVFDDSISLAIIKFNKTIIRQSTVSIEEGQDSKKAGRILASDLNAHDLSAIFILSDGLNVNGSLLIDGLRQELSDEIVITGGLAGDGDRFKSTWVLSDFEMSSKCISAIGFYGRHIHFSHGSKGGWDVLGVEREVTRSDANVLYELDNQPALDLYKKYLGERAEGLPSTGLLFPLAILNDDEDGKTVRTILAVDETNKSITFAGNIPQGKNVQLMQANFDRLIEGAYQAAKNVLADSDLKSGSHSSFKPNKLSIAISCVGRRLVLGQRVEEELEATLDVFSDETQQIGFYSYGEISPLASGRCDLHNQTMTLTVIEEDDA
ncbi:MAG: hypothetical protein GY694_09295 [Gammaproteobacteria bacterium]|nr:hypothetical protein [Gammaproteobacteria bacterium]